MNKLEVQRCRRWEISHVISSHTLSHYKHNNHAWFPVKIREESGGKGGEQPNTHVHPGSRPTDDWGVKEKTGGVRSHTHTLTHQHILIQDCVKEPWAWILPFREQKRKIAAATSPGELCKLWWNTYRRPHKAWPVTGQNREKNDRYKVVLHGHLRTFNKDTVQYKSGQSVNFEKKKTACFSGKANYAKLLSFAFTDNFCEISWNYNCSMCNGISTFHKDYYFRPDASKDLFFATSCFWYTVLYCMSKK